MPRILFPIAALCLLLAACGGDRGADAADPTASADEALPAPPEPAGGVTGMPDAPGPGEVPLAGEPPPEPWLAPDARFGLPPLQDNPETGLAATETNEAATTGPRREPGPEDAVKAIEDYYAAIAARDYPRAYALWSDGGRSSGQSPEQFAAGFADTAQVSVHTGQPGAVEGAAGSRYVEIPVSVSARQADGGTRHYVGTYTLRRAVVDGASDEQRAWHIVSAELRELVP